jgi:hypothetical protein
LGFGINRDLGPTHRFLALAGGPNLDRAMIITLMRPAR